MSDDCACFSCTPNRADLIERRLDSLNEDVEEAIADGDMSRLAEILAQGEKNAD